MPASSYQDVLQHGIATGQRLVGHVAAASCTKHSECRSILTHQELLGGTKTAGHLTRKDLEVQRERWHTGYCIVRWDFQ